MCFNGFFLYFFQLKVNSIFCRIPCVDGSIFHRFDVLTFRCFVFRCLVWQPQIIITTENHINTLNGWIALTVSLKNLPFDCKLSTMKEVVDGVLYHATQIT